MKYSKEIEEKIKNFLREVHTEVDLSDYVDIENIDLNDPYNSIHDIVMDSGGFNVEIIYYSEAIKYLAENDPSLNESLECAEELGFQPKNLNSEILASLLASEQAQEEYAELEQKITDFFDEIKEEIEIADFFDEIEEGIEEEEDEEDE